MWYYARQALQRSREEPMARNITLAEQVTLLFAYGESRGISAAYRAIATGTGENANNIRKIHRGENLNPGLRIMKALTHYFHVDLAYFNCQTRYACKQYLREIARKRLIQRLEKSNKGLSAESQEFFGRVFDYLRKLEGLPPVDKTMVAESDRPERHHGEAGGPRQTTGLD